MKAGSRGKKFDGIVHLEGERRCGLCSVYVRALRAAKKCVGRQRALRGLWGTGNVGHWDDKMVVYIKDADNGHTNLQSGVRRLVDVIGFTIFGICRGLNI